MRKILSLFLLTIFCSVGFAQEKTVSGVVTGEDGSPLSGATVSAKGAQASTVTNAAGKFTLTVPVKVKTLVVSYVGLSSEEVPVGAGSISVQLKSQATEMAEVVVTGVSQATSKKKVSFSLTSVKGSDINIVPQLDASQSLRGRVAGVQINQVQGDRGATVFLRGAKSVFGNIPPLIVVDGFQTSLTLSDLNPEDIETIEVVKGAAASSLYGTRAEGGVIQVITKKGKSSNGRPVIVVDGEYGVNGIQRLPELTSLHFYKLNADGSFELDDDGQRVENKQANGFSLNLSPYSKTYNNTDALLGDRPFSNVSMSISNANGPLKYYASFQNQTRGGAVKPISSDQRNTVKINVGYTPWKDIETNVTFQYINFDRPSDFVSRNDQGTLFAATLQYEPFINLLEKNADGSYKAKPTGFEIQNANLNNPLYEWSQRQVTSVADNMLLGGDFRWKFYKGFDLFISGSVNTERGNSSNYYPDGFQTVTPNATLNNGYYGVGSSTNIFKNGNVQLNYNTNVKDFEIGASLKMIYEEYRFESNTASGYRLSSPVKNLAATDPESRDMSSFWSQTVNYGYMANGRLGWKNKVFVDALLRMDRSSRYGPDVQNALFPRVSAAYRITQDFKLGPVNELKARVAWGRAGSLPPFNAKNSIAEVSATGISLVQLQNTDLDRSITDELEVGFDGQIFNRINFNLTYARANSKGDFIQPPSVQPINGSSGITKNLGSVKSFAYELELNGDVIRSKDFVWNTGLTFTVVRSRIDDLGNIPAFQNGIEDSDPLFRKEEGLSAYGFWGQKVVRNVNDLVVDKATGFVTNVRTSAAAVTGLKPEDFAVNSLGFVVRKSVLGTANEVPLFFANAATGNNFFLGRGEPDFQIGIPTNLTFKKNFNLFFLIDWKQGGYKYNQTVQYLTFDYRTQVAEDVLRAGLPKAFLQQLYNGNNITDYWLEKSSFVAIRELSLAYNLNGKELLGNLSKVVKNIRFAVIGRNLFMFTNYRGVNPEGYWEYYPYPVYRTISGKVTFNLF